MISRSVPGYEHILNIIEKLAKRYAKPNQRIYDLGCSLGAASLAAAHGAGSNADIYAIDNSAAMLARCQRYIRQFSHASTIKLFENDVTHIDIDNACVLRRACGPRGGSRWRCTLRLRGGCPVGSGAHCIGLA